MTFDWKSCQNSGAKGCLASSNSRHKWDNFWVVFKHCACVNHERFITESWRGFFILLCWLRTAFEIIYGSAGEFGWIFLKSYKTVLSDCLLFQMKHAKERFSSSWLFLLNFQESDIKEELTEIDYKRKSSSFMKQLSSDEVPTVDDYRIADEPISDTHMTYVSSIDDPEGAKHVAFSGDDEDQAEITGKNASLYCTGALCSKLTLSTI